MKKFKLPIPQSRKLEIAKRQLRKDLILHFKKDGWDLDFFHLVNQLAQDITNIDFGGIVLEASRDIAVLAIRGKSCVLIKRKKKKFK